MKHLLVMTILVWLALNCFSQNIEYGIGTGVNFNRMKIDLSGAEPMNSRLGFQVNALLKYHLTEQLALRAEPGYLVRSSRSNALSVQKFTLEYLNLPVLIDYSPFEKKLSFLLGPEMALRLSAKLKGETNMDIRDVFDRKFDLGVRAGMCYALFPQLELSASYYHGFVSVDKRTFVLSETHLPIDERDGFIFNRGFLFGIGFWVK